MFRPARGRESDRGVEIAGRPGSARIRSMLTNTRRQTLLIAAVSLLPSAAFAADDLGTIRAEIARSHDAGVKRLQEWIHQPSIAAENRGMTEGCDMMMRLAREA